jgi:outer membrane protein assembly factor BamB
MTKFAKTLGVMALILALSGVHEASSPVVAWPRFRGPNGSGIAEGNAPPIAFGPGEKVLWKTPVPPGHSSAVVWDDHIFITAVDGPELVTIALRRRDGRVLWRRAAPATRLEPVHAFNNAAAPTPATDGERVYVYFGSYGLLAYHFDGREAWRHPLPLPPSRNGTATSSIVLGQTLLLQRDGNGTDSELLAVDAATGAVAWRTPRPLLRNSYSTPMVWATGDQVEIVTVGTSRVVAYGLDGVERWWVSGLTQAPITLAVAGDGLLFASSTQTGSEADPIAIPAWQAIVSQHDQDGNGRIPVDAPPEDDGIVHRPDVPADTPGNFLALRSMLAFADSDKDRLVTRSEWDGFLQWVRANSDNAMAIRPGGHGDSTATHVAWRATRGLPELPSPLLYQERVYFVRNGGMVTSYNAQTGTVFLDRRRLGALGHYVASPVAADGRIYVASEPGVVVVFRAGDELDVLARNDLQESITATPAIADHKLYIRTSSHLWAFGDQTGGRE